MSQEGGGLQTRVFLSIVCNTNKQRRKPATRGMASQHLWTFERMDIFKSADLNESPNKDFLNALYFFVAWMV